MDGIARARRRRRGGPARAATGWPTSTARRSARGRRPRRGPRPTRSSCRPGGTRWCSSRPPSPTCCRPSPSSGFNGKAVQRAAVVRASSARPSSTRRSRWSTTRCAGRGAAVRRRGHARGGGSTLVDGGHHARGRPRPADRRRGRAPRHRARVAGRRRARGRSPRNLRLLPAAARPARPAGRGRRPGGRRRRRRAGGRRRPGAAGHRPLVHPGARPAHAGRHRPDPQRRVADRGRRGRPGRSANFRFTQSYPQALGPGRGARARARAPVRQPDRVDGAWWAAPGAAPGLLELHRRRLRLSAPMAPDDPAIVDGLFRQARHTGRCLARTARRDRRNVCHLAASVDPAWSLVCA